MNTPNRKPVSLETRRKMSDRKRAMWATPGFKEWYFTHVKPRKPHIKSGGYYWVRRPDHPESNPKGYVIEQRFVMEQHLGRYLLPYEIVHHRNHNKYDNRVESVQGRTDSEDAKVQHRKPTGANKLTATKAIQIMADYRLDKLTYQQMAEKYHVSYNTIYRIATGRSHAAATGLDPSRVVNKKAAILTAEQVVKIRAQYATKHFSQSELARQYGTSQPNINAIVNGRLWKHLL